MLTNKAKVLVVDDETLIAEMVTTWLSEDGYECAAAPDAAHALGLLSEGDFHMVLLDINMPGKSGMNLLPEIKRQYPDTSVIMMTGVVDTNIAVRAMKQGASDYVIKPFKLVDLTERVSQELERRSAAMLSKGYWFGLERRSAEQTFSLDRREQELKALNNLIQTHLNEVFSNVEPNTSLQENLKDYPTDPSDLPWGRMAIVDTKPFKLSLSHKAESSSMLSFWIPAFAGMTAYVAVFHTLSGWS